MNSQHDIQAALSHIPAHDRDVWVRMAMAVKSELGDNGYEIWDEWSQSAENYRERDAKAVWRGIKDSGGVGIGTLIHEAKQRGYKPNGTCRTLSSAEIERERQERAERNAKAESEQRERQETAAAQAQEIWKRNTAPVDAHDYADSKCIKPTGARIYTGQIAINGKRCNGALTLPIRNTEEELRSLQFITPDGDKLYLPNGEKSGNYFSAGVLANGIVIAEGYATAMSIMEATGKAVAVAFDAGNLAKVASAIRAKLPDAEITIAGDNDAWTDGNPGSTKAREAASAIHARVVIPKFSDVTGNPTDFNDLAQREGLDAVRAQIEQAQRPDAVASQTDDATRRILADDPDRVLVRLLNGGQIEPERIRWLWNGWLAKGKFHIMAGSPGTGKTTIALAIAATISVGGRFPDGTKCEPGNVLIWSGEDDARDTLLPRLLAMGADRSRIYFVSDAYLGGESIPFDPAKHFAALADAALAIGGVQFMVVDPIVSAVAGDSHKAAEVRRSLQPVVDLAAKLDAAMVGISHFSKGTAGNDPLERVTGSNAFGALPRIVMATAKVKSEENPDAVPQRILVRAKSNIGPDGGGYNYSLEQTAVRGYANLYASAVLWGEGLDGSAKQLLASAENETDPDEQHEQRSAVDWLRDLLGETEGMTGGEIIKLAKANGFSERTIYRTKNKLGLAVKVDGFGKEKTSTWRLPNRAATSNPAINPANTANLENGRNGSNGGSNEDEVPI